MLRKRKIVLVSLSLALTGALACKPPAGSEEHQEEDEGMGDFVPKPDMGAFACRHDQEPDRFDCPAETKCMPFGEDFLKEGCFPLSDPALEIGDPCVDDDLEDGLDQCEAGSMCIPNEGGQICAPFCTLTDGGGYVCPSDTQSCTVSQDDGNRWCVENCDPTESSCNSGSCIWVGYGFFCGTPGTKQYGEQCIHGAECDSGMTCVAMPGVPDCEGVGCCTPFCKEGDDVSCPDFAEGQQCVTGLAAPEGFSDVGVCSWP